jgi:hypothetical protein
VIERTTENVSGDDERAQGSQSQRVAPEVARHQPVSQSTHFEFAYLLPGDKTVIRGGAGTFYSNMITVGGMSSIEINPPNHVRISQTTDRTIPSIFQSQGFAADALVPAHASDVNLVSYDRSDKVPTAYQ